MAHTKAGGSTKLGRDSAAKRLGVKIQDGQSVGAGQIIIRQRGTKYHLGKNVAKGGDDTIFALKNGTVKFTEKSKINFDHSKKRVTLVHVQ